MPYSSVPTTWRFRSACRPAVRRCLPLPKQLAKAVPDGVALGIYIDDPAKCGDWAARRFALQCVSFDGRMLANGARAVVTQAKPGDRERTSKR